jgi:hypothetical protein
MIRQELQEYIKKSIESGISNEQIKDELLKSGWPKEEIEENLNNLHSAPSPQSVSVDYSQLGTANYRKTEISAQKPKRKIFKKILLSFAGIIIFLVIFFFAFPYVASIFSKDIAPIDDSDLQLTKVSVPDNENAYFDLIKLNGENIVIEQVGNKKLSDALSNGDIYKFDYLNDQEYNELMNKNEKALSYFYQADKKPKFQDPQFTDYRSSPQKYNFSFEIVSMGSWRSIIRVSTVKAIHLSKTGQTKESLDEAFKIIGIGHKLQVSHDGLLHYLAGLSIQNVGLQTAEKIIRSTNVQPEILSAYARKLNDFGKNEKTLKNYYNGQYIMVANFLDTIATNDAGKISEVFGEQGINIFGEQGINILNALPQKPNQSFYFKPNKTKVLYADLARANIKRASCTDYSASDTIEKILLSANNPTMLNNSNKIVSIISAFFTENAIGKILFSVSAVSLTTASDKACIENLSVSALQALMAIKAYKIQNGNYPLTLESLVPRYLSETPKDPYNDQALKYSKDKKIIYSVGSDKKDDGGSQGDDWKLMPDPTFKIEF